MRTTLVGVAGAVGAALRYRIGLLVAVRTFPYATLAINLAGCFVLALLVAGASERWSPTTITVAAIGFLGAFTTFSAFGYETLTMLRTDRAVAALVYVSGSVAGGVALAAAGYALGRRLA